MQQFKNLFDNFSATLNLPIFVSDTSQAITYSVPVKGQLTYGGNTENIVAMSIGRSGTLNNRTYTLYFVVGGITGDLIEMSIPQADLVTLLGDSRFYYR